MKKIVGISLVIIVLVGACTVTLLLNKKKIDAKSKQDGNLKTIPVFVTELKKNHMSGDFSANGTFSAIHELMLASEGQGKVVNLLIKTGDFVKQGQVLARLDDEVLRSQFSLAQAAFEKAKADLLKYEGLLKDDAISNQQVEDARLFAKKSEADVVSLKKQLDNAAIKAPIQGTIVKRMIETGSLVMPGAPVAEIVDISRLKFVANLTESEAVLIRVGQKATISSSIYPGINYQGVVVSVGVKADEARRFPVEIELVNESRHPLKAGMFGTAGFGSGMERECLTIPRRSIIGSIKDPKVYVVEGNRSILRSIRIGSADDKQVEVLDGLKEGEIIVTAGQINLDNNSIVTIVNNK
ncbi:MAG: efflux RND transporter periplasmic adaptor subunit [Bacteroidales bacterium]|jgi:RND family efflux transporter MFP subunit|nr:efflux RND transporter periplasmic adaptor subunit [Bacteroidales bacterium]